MVLVVYGDTPCIEVSTELAPACSLWFSTVLWAVSLALTVLHNVMLLRCLFPHFWCSSNHRWCERPCTQAVVHYCVM